MSESQHESFCLMQRKMEALAARADDLSKMMRGEVTEGTVATFDGQDTDPSVVKVAQSHELWPIVRISKKQLEEVRDVLYSQMARLEAAHHHGTPEAQMDAVQSVIEESHRLLTCRAVALLRVNFEIDQGHRQKNEGGTIVLGTICTAVVAGIAARIESISLGIVAGLMGIHCILNIRDMCVQGRKEERIFRDWCVSWLIN